MQRFASALICCCVLSVHAALAATPDYPGRAFVTSTSGTANLSSWADLGGGGLTGLAAADRICQIRANAGGLPTPEHYRAWLSTASTDAYCHIIDRSGKKSANCGLPALPGGIGPWSSPDGRVIITDLAQAMHPIGVLYHTFDRDENANPVSATNAQLYWTGTNALGEFEVNFTTCSDWTSNTGGSLVAIGKARHSSHGWVSWGYTTCSDSRHLLCMTAKGGSDIANPEEGSGAQAFVSSVTGNGNLSSWADAGGRIGVAAADRICQVRAAAAGLNLAATFKALISAGPGQAAIDRFQNDGPRYRLDGVRIADSLADLADGDPATALNLDELGIYRGYDQSAWTGSDSFGEPADYHCNSWTSASAAVQGMLGEAASADSRWLGFTYVGCNDTERRLYCVSDASPGMVARIFADGMENSPPQ